MFTSCFRYLHYSDFVCTNSYSTRSKRVVIRYSTRISILVFDRELGSCSDRPAKLWIRTVHRFHLQFRVFPSRRRFLMNMRWFFLINIQWYKSILKRNVIQHHIHLEVTNKHFIIFKCFERIGCASGLLCDIAISSLISNWRVPKTDWKGVIIDSGGYLLEPISCLINSFFSQCSRIKPYGVFPLWYKIGPIYLWNMTDNSNCYR